MENDVLKRYNQPYWEEFHLLRQNGLSRYNLAHEDEMDDFIESDLYNLLPVEATLDNSLDCGINASRRWHTTKVYALPNGGLPIIEQPDKSVGCTQAVIKSIHEYFGGQPIELDDAGADFRVLAIDLRKENKIRFSVHEFPKSLHRIKRELENGHPVVLTYPVGDPMPHTVGINRIYMQEKERIRERAREREPRQRTIIEVMDPQYFSYKILSQWDFDDSVVRVAIPD